MGLLRKRGTAVTILDAIALRDPTPYEQFLSVAATHQAIEKWRGVIMDEAIFQGNVARVRLLLDAGVSPMVRGNTPMTQATIHNCGEIERLLRDRGADPNRRTSPGGRAMKFARQKRNPAIIRLLKESGNRR